MAKGNLFQGIQTTAIHAGEGPDPATGASAPPLHMSSTFVTENVAGFSAHDLGEDSAFLYARWANPNVASLEAKIAALQGTQACLCTASGMAAVNGALTSMLKAGDHVVSAKALFGSCLYILENILTRFGVEVTFVDGTDLDAWRAAMRPDTKAVFFESMSNPTLEVIDIKAVAEIAHSVGATVVVDNVFSTPVFSDAIAQGADVVVSSATKHIDGQGRVLGGVILGTRDFILGTVEPYTKPTGGSLSPFSAWTLLKGLETITLRVNAQAESALQIAEALNGHPALERTIYPGLADHAQNALVQSQLGGKGGTVLSLDLKGGKEAAFTFLNALTIPVISNNLGDAKSIATHPATTTHQRLSDVQKDDLGITPGLVRFSVGLEDTQDLIADLTQALAAASA